MTADPPVQLAVTSGLNSRVDAESKLYVDLPKNVDSPSTLNWLKYLVNSFKKERFRLMMDGQRFP